VPPQVRILATRSRLPRSRRRLCGCRNDGAVIGDGPSGRSVSQPWRGCENRVLFTESHRSGGNSFGGIETVLGVERGGYCAGIDSAGGAQSWAQASELQSLMTRAVRMQKPNLLFSGANDFDLSPSKTLSAEMNEVSKAYKLKIYPPTATPLGTATALATLEPTSGPKTFSDF